MTQLFPLVQFVLLEHMYNVPFLLSLQPHQDLWHPLSRYLKFCASLLLLHLHTYLPELLSSSAHHYLNNNDIVHFRNIPVYMPHHFYNTSTVFLLHLLDDLLHFLHYHHLIFLLLLHGINLLHALLFLPQIHVPVFHEIYLFHKWLFQHLHFHIRPPLFLSICPLFLFYHSRSNTSL